MTAGSGNEGRAWRTTRGEPAAASLALAYLRLRFVRSRYGSRLVRSIDTGRVPAGGGAVAGPVGSDANGGRHA